MVLAKNKRRRRGLSYLEVLIAAGIALTGILGAIAMFPVAVLNMQKGVVVDTIAGGGPTALDTAPSFGVNRTPNWMIYNAGAQRWNIKADQFIFNVPPAGTPSLPAYPLGRWSSICIDPRFCAEMSPATPIANVMQPDLFPYKPRTGADDVRMLRVTLRSDPNSFTFPVPLTIQQSRLLFKFSDDLLFTKTSDYSGPLPALQDYIQGSNGAQRRNYYADYEYILTLTPSLRGVPVDANGTSFVYGVGMAGVGELAPLETPSEYLLSAVVFYRRQARLEAYIAPLADGKEPETERVVDVIRAPGNGFGGGDVIIQSRTGSNVAGSVSELELHEGDYVMLSGNAYSISAPRKFMGSQFRWYRVAAVQGAAYQHSSGFWRRYVTLDGPDWPVTSTPAAMPQPDPDDATSINPAASLIPTTQMTIVSGVVGVFSTPLPVSNQ